MNVDYKNVIRGKIAKRNGQMFESRISEALEWYQFRGKAYVEKTPEPMRAIKSLGGGKFVAIFEKKGQSDYKGVVGGGRAVLFEAKFTTTDRLESGRVLPHQERYLDDYEKLGALCFVIAGFDDGSVFKVPWYIWKDMKKYFGHKYVTESDLESFRVKETHLGILLLFE